MATSRPVRIARTPLPEAGAPRVPTDLRANVAGSQRVVRVTLVYLIVLVALFLAFLLYDRSVPGGTASPAGNGEWVFAGIFVLFAIAGSVLTLHPAPRAVEVTPDHLTVFGRWGGHRILPPIGSLSTRVVRRYPSGFLCDAPVEQVELWGRGAPLRTYLVEEGVFRGTLTNGAAR